MISHTIVASPADIIPHISYTYNDSIQAGLYDFMIKKTIAKNLPAKSH